MVVRDLEKLHEAVFKYIFIDEVTLMKDFIGGTLRMGENDLDDENLNMEDVPG